MQEAVFFASSPGIAKHMGRAVRLRSDWEEVKDDVMLELLRMKFGNSKLGAKLLDTGDQELIEGNDWHDTYWSVYRGKGKNMLGKLLMQVRTELQEKRS